ncbi:hypothetical protein BJ165DRAFT_402427 [Panaeolus papilionaceus]|nr:hypothetical protein BJ165DRAFT_402427 [Panaeolus papilionaceus]
MPASHSLAHRRAVAAMLKRDPQTGFIPTAIFGDPPIPDVTSTPGGPGGDDDTTSLPTSTPTPAAPTSSDPPSSTLPTSSVESTSSTPSAAPTTSADTPRPAAPTTTTPLVVTGKATTAIVTKALPSTTSSLTPTSSSTSVTANNDSTEGISTGAVVGGIGAGIVAIAAIGFAAAYFVRRAKRKGPSEDHFEPSSFRRSAVLLNDPRPPSMIENRNAGNPPTTPYGSGGAPAPYPASEYSYTEPNGAGYGAQPYQSFAPGQVVGPGGYAQPSPFSPSAPYGYYNETEYYSQVQPMNPAAPGMGMVGTYPVLTRQPSAGAQYGYPQQGYAQGQQGHDPLPHEHAPAGDYVDLDRSSVSPFQAQQYAEISRRLNTEVPMGQQPQEMDRDLPPVPPKEAATDPFASAPPSPAPSMPAPAMVNPHDRTVSPPSPSYDNGRPSQDSFRAPTGPQDMDFPIPPPSPVLSVSRYDGQRVESMPPVLNLNLENRPMSFGVANAGSANGGPAPAVPVLAQAVPIQKSSPLAQPPQQQGQGDAKKRAASIYDPEDAYGGF